MNKTKKQLYVLKPGAPRHDRCSVRGDGNGPNRNGDVYKHSIMAVSFSMKRDTRKQLESAGGKSSSPLALLMAASR
jgi:hypothetical protein